ncbi:hypothetical protein ASG30_06295 [Ramlibacter sp. Leaf400]|nr:hypothetical protein [Ramlibacter sp. Leaf400]KQT11477.1 hypothetical protein ASG30_06295 [Ramlibacter sp. Leaf400]
MQLTNAVVLITGANRGIGLAFARECGDANVLINNGVAETGGFLQDATLLREALNGLEAGVDEVLADLATRQVKQSLSTPAAAYLAAA